MRQLFIILPTLVFFRTVNVFGQTKKIIDSTNFSGRLLKVDYASNQQTFRDSLINYSFDCLGSKLKIHVPFNYSHIDYFQYTEGQILTIRYPDSSSISILCGTQANISIQESKTKGLHYKKVIVKGYQVIYENVPGQKLRLFNNAFELLNEDIK
ncbi:MAG: hypothetical protein ABIN94_07015 [Ferruginibacter sp.]